MSTRTQAADLNGQGCDLREQGKLLEAAEFFQRASALDPKWSTPLYNLGLVFKTLRRWPDSLKYNGLATALDASNDAAWWNLGIAATALGRWDVARTAWRGFGIDIPKGEGPIDFPCGFGPIRLDPGGCAEVVWAFRLDPARASLASIPFPESKYRWKDVVLNDGEPVGYRRCGGKDIPVFNALELLERSAFGTFVAEVKMPSNREYIVELTKQAAAAGCMAEDWSTSVNFICKACSEGRPHQVHDTEREPKNGMHLIGIAAHDRQEATHVLHGWESNTDDVHVATLHDALEPG